MADRLERDPSSDDAAKPRRRRSRWRKMLGRYLGYVGTRFAMAIVGRLSLPFGLRLARAVGNLSYLFARKSRRIAVENLTRVYGSEHSPAKIRRMVRQVFQNTVATAIEYTILRRWSVERLEAEFPQCAAEVRAFRDRVHASGRGHIGISAHFGNWELGALLFSRFAPGFLYPIATRAYYPRYQELAHRLRTEDGLDVIYNDDSPRRFYRVLRDGKLLGLLPDQNLRTNSATFVDFLGAPAYTTTVPADLSRHLDVPWCSCLLARLDPGLRRIGYRLEIGESRFVAKTDDAEKDVEEGTLAWSQALEEAIRRSPTQWSWIHQRWKNQPGNPRLRHRTAPTPPGGGAPSGVSGAR